MVKWPGIVLVYFFILEPQIVIIMLSGAPFRPESLSSSSLTLLCWRHHVPPSKKRENWLKTGWLSMVTESDKKKRRPSCWYDAMTFATMFCHNGVVSFSGCHSVDNFIAVVLIVGLTSFAFFSSMFILDVQSSWGRSNEFLMARLGLDNDEKKKH